MVGLKHSLFDNVGFLPYNLGRLFSSCSER